MNITVLGVITSVISAAISGFIAIMMKNVNDDTRAYREKRKANERKEKEEEQQERERQKEALLAMMRMMLKDNADRCLDKGYYTLEEREVYHAMYEVYVEYGGNGIIKDLGIALRALPYEKEARK